MSAPANPMPSVLVIDDEPLNVEIVCMHLEHLGVTQVSTALNGRKALRLLRGSSPHPDLIMLDIYMPEMDGIEFLRELDQMGYRGHILLLSGVNVDMLTMARQIALDLGLQVIGAAVKPMKVELLADLLSRVNQARTGTH